VVSDRGVCLAANASFVLTFNGAENEVKAAGKPAQRVVGRRLLDLFPEDGPVNAAFHRQFPQMLIAREGSAECCLSSPEGEVLWLEVRARPVEWAGLPAVMLTCADVSALRRTREQLERVTSEDCATGLLSRQGMERLLSRKVECAFRDRTPLSLIMLDVDGLRKINEVEGYAAADHALKALAAALKDILSGELAGTPPEVVGRWGGDEFMVLTFRSGPAARALANILRDRVHGGAFDLENAMTLSVGVAELRGDMDVSAFVGAAFDAMTAARRSGGNRTVLAEERGTVPGLERDFNRRDGTS
ncbi:MAG: diguanylate cyclase, partial [Fretibacterium sp.]|nr:diguanylate cyclase [Fretibacterium sp.]